MSLAPAQKDTSTSPPSNAVIDPVDKTAKEKDVDRKVSDCGQFIRTSTFLTISLAHVLHDSPRSSSIQATDQRTTARCQLSCCHAIPGVVGDGNYGYTNLKRRKSEVNLAFVPA